MDWSKLPPLNSLRAFACVAEVGSYSGAAGQLKVTHAAVSQQVKLLETHLEVALVRRTGRSIQLTEAGALLARDLGVGFAAIERGIERLSESTANRPVRVTMSPAFAVEWLMPRIAEFQEENPTITLLLNPTSKIMDLSSNDFDVAIRYRDRRHSPPDARSVLVTDMIVVGTPSLLDGYDLPDAASLAGLPWLQELGTNEVADWFTHHGVIPDRALTINHMPGNLIMDAVRRGDGITYTARAFFREELENGTLIELSSEPEFGVYEVRTPPEYTTPAARVFVDWLMSRSETVSA